MGKGQTLKHFLNPLHVYCRLRDLGFPKTMSIWICKQYEKAYKKICRRK